MFDFKIASTISTSIKTRLLQLPHSQSQLHPNTESAAYSKLVFTGCYQKIQPSSLISLMSSNRFYG